MEELDENIALLFGDPIPFERSFVYPLTIKQIKKIGISDFYSILYLIMSDQSDLSIFSEEPIREFAIFFSNIIFNPNDLFVSKIVLVLESMFKEEVCISDDSISIGKETAINVDNYMRFVEIIKKQYCLKKQKQIIAKNSKQQEYLRRLAEMRKKYENFIKEEDISDYISSVCAKDNKVDYVTIQDWTIYQLFNRYKRLNRIDEFFISIDQLLAGASKDEVKVVHWSKRLTD